MVKRLDEGNEAATRLAILGEKKMALKAKYYEEKLELMRQKNDILSRIADALTDKKI